MAGKSIYERIEAMFRELEELQRAIEPIRATFAHGAAPTPAPGRRSPRRPRRAGRRRAAAPRKMTPAVARLRQQQGQYMGLLRHLKPAQKAAVKKVRGEKGLPAAIAAARKLAG